MKTIKILAFSLMATSGMLLTSCGDDDSNGNDLPPIGGYNNAGEVGAADLLAYWSLNGNGEEDISGTMPSSSVGATYVDAVKGQGVKLNSGYLDYPTIPNLAVQNTSLTVSFWCKISNTKLVVDGVSTISPIISFTGGPNTNIGNLSIFGNTHGLVSSDSIQLKAEYHFAMPDGTSSFNGDCINMIKQETWMDNTHTWNANKIGGQWAHVVYVWDATTARTRIYVNGVKISNSAWEARNVVDGQDMPMPMTFFTPTHPIIGALATVVDGTNTDTWNAALKGEVDEIRVWKKMLIQADINALYELEKAGR